NARSDRAMSLQRNTRNGGSLRARTRDGCRFFAGRVGEHARARTSDAAARRLLAESCSTAARASALRSRLVRGEPRALVPSRPMRNMIVATCLGIAACASGPTAQETLPKLRAAIDSEVRSPEQNAEHSALVEQV